MFIEDYFNHIACKKQRAQEVKRWCSELQVSHVTVSMWKSGKKTPTKDKARRIEFITNGAVSRQEAIKL